MQRVIALMSLFFVQVVSAIELYPLHLGAVWWYEAELNGVPQEIMQSYIQHSVVVDGVEWFELVEDGQRFWVRNTPDGQAEAENYFDRDLNISEPIDEVLIFKYPAVVGETWSGVESSIAYLGLHTIEVPAGVFECHMYHFKDMDEVFSESCIAEGVGIVYNKFKDDGNKTSVIKLLKMDK